MHANPNIAEAFINRWDGTAKAERANVQGFIYELCDVLDVPRPDPATGGLGPYRFERNVTHRGDDGTTTTRRIDLYRRGCFVFEAKQGASPHRQAGLFTGEMEAQHRANIRNTPAWTRHMQQAKGQAEGYARDLPIAEGYPPFLIVCDVGFCFDLYADFSGLGKHYAQHSDGNTFRIYLSELRDPAIRARLRAVWMDPTSLNSALRRTEVTRGIAALLAKLAAALEGTTARPRHAPQQVATFLMRCIFCMFAQSVGLLPRRTSFSDLLRRCQGNPPAFLGLVAELWRTMDVGGFSAALAAAVLRFNGGLFRPGPHGGADPLPVNADELALLITAAGKDWADVEPAIFGTLLEQALDTKERGRLGAEFTPRPFVERLVLPTVMEPLRADWDGVRAAAETAMQANDAPAAAALVRGFHGALCNVRVLDPACGTGNFLYVTLELMKRLEGEVLDALAGYARGDTTLLDVAGATVDPHQFLGLDVNPRAVPVAELVLWIGYLQWHFRTNGRAPPAEPILRDFRTIREADALLSYTRTEADRDGAGRPVTKWGGRTKLHPITGEDVPDLADQVLTLRPVGGKPAQWPEADFIVGNPPFVAGKDLRAELGGYAEALWAAYPKVPPSADLAMFFWWKAAQAVQGGKVRRFGLITSNSIRQVFCRRVVAGALAGAKPLRLLFAIPDHPWAQGAGAAAVRIAMTVAARDDTPGRLLTVVREGAGAVPEVAFTEQEGVVNADLTVGASPDAARALRANERISSRGMSLHGAGFIVSPAVAAALGLSRVPGLERHIRPYLNGKDMTGRSRGVMVIDLFGLTEAEVRQRFPAVFQHLLLHVKPERDQNNRGTYRDAWWVFGEPRRDLRPALAGLPRFIATVETAKHRPFVFQPAAVLPDNKLCCIASDDAFHLGVLSSSIHATWVTAAGGLLEDRPVYVKTKCFDPFPFPAATPTQAAVIAALAEELDVFRKACLLAHPHLTLTGLYNVLDALRAGQALTLGDKDVLDAGRIAVLRHLHDRLDAAVAEAYGWPAGLSATAVVEQVVALNRERAAEEAAGTVRWLRPAFQAPAEEAQAARKEQLAMAVDADATLPAWPRAAGAQYVVLRATLSRTPAAPADLARRFRGARPAKLAPMLKTLAALGQAREAGSGRYVS